MNRSSIAKRSRSMRKRYFFARGGFLSAFAYSSKRPTFFAVGLISATMSLVRYRELVRG